VFISALSLALGASSLALPAVSLATGVAVAVCFSPEEDCTALAVDAIDRAEAQILVNAYGLTTSSSTVEALVRAKQRGVDVRLIASGRIENHLNRLRGTLESASCTVVALYTARRLVPQARGGRLQRRI
jgi:hypothetical protein